MSGLIQFLPRLSLTWVIAAGVTALAACGESQPSRFYVLSAMQSQQTDSNGSALKKRVIGIGPIELPQYLDRAQIVTFSGDNRVQLAEFDRWAEPLEDSFTRALSENIAAMTPASRVDLYPFLANSDELPDYHLTVQVIQFRVTASGAVDLVANWNIAPRTDRRQIIHGKSAVSTRRAGDDAVATVDAMSRAVEDLSRDIARAILPLLNAS